jgi:hypothetical protein
VKWSVEPGHVSKCHLDRAVAAGSPRGVIFYGLACWDCQSVEDFFLTREEAEESLRRVLEDEPSWTDAVGLVRLDFSGSKPVVKEMSRSDAA